MYLLADVRFKGTMTENPYLASVGLTGSTLEARLRGLSSLAFRRQGDLVDLGWEHVSLPGWAAARLGCDEVANGAPK